MLVQDEEFYDSIRNTLSHNNITEWYERLEEDSLRPYDDTNKYVGICANFPKRKQARVAFSTHNSNKPSIEKFKKEIIEDALLSNDNDFIKIRFRGFESEKIETLLAGDEKPLKKIEDFLEVYENFQRKHRTTLNQALIGYTRRVNRRHLLFRARIVGEERSDFTNFFHHINKKEFDFFVFNIPAILRDNLINKVIREKLGDIDSCLKDPAARKKFYEALNTGVENCYWSLKHNEALSVLKNKILEAGIELLLNGEKSIEGEKADLILHEMSRLLLGISLFIEYSGDYRTQLDIYLTNLIGKEWIGFLSRLGQPIKNDCFTGLFSGLLIASEALSPEKTKGDQRGIVKELIEKIGESIQNINLLKNESDDSRNKGWFEFKKMINHAKTDVDKKFIVALSAALRFSTIYRPLSVHEGKEQQLNFIVGFPDEIESLLAEFIELRNEQKEALVYLPTKIVGYSKEVIDPRSFFKSSCNIFSNNDLAIFVDASSVDDRKNTVACPWVRVIETPIFRYPRARHLCDLINDKYVGLITIYGRTKIDFFYKGDVALSWTDHTPVWVEAKCWSVNNLANKILEIIGVQNTIDVNKRLKKIVNVLFSISRLPHEGAAVCFCNNSHLDLEQPVIEEEEPKFESFVQSMTYTNVNGLNFINEILDHNDKAIEKMLTLDGGSVFHISTGQLCVRRKFMGNLIFGPSMKVTDITNHNSLELYKIWEKEGTEGESEIHQSSMRWDNWQKYKEWGTRHQQSLSLSAIYLKEVELDNNGTYTATNNPNFAVLVVSEDGGITLMHNGRVIEPDA